MDEKDNSNDPRIIHVPRQEWLGIKDDDEIAEYDLDRIVVRRDDLVYVVAQ